MGEFKHSEFMAEFMHEFELAKREVGNWPKDIQLEAHKTSVLTFPVASSLVEPKQRSSGREGLVKKTR